MERGITMTPLPAAAGRRRLNPKFVAGGLVIALALGYLLLSNLQNNMVYYLRVDELRGQAAQLGNRQVRVAGNVAPGTIERDVSTGTLRFQVQDPSGPLPVVYRGVVPDIFNDQAEVVVEGKYGQDGVFQASTLLAKCPSRYEGQIDAPADAPTGGR